MNHRIKQIILALWANILIAAPAMAEGINGLGDEKTAEDLNKKAWMLGTDYLIPMGMGFIFLVIVLVSLKITGASLKPEKKAEAMGSLGTVLQGAAVLIFSALAIGILIGIYNKVNS